MSENNEELTVEDNRLLLKNHLEEVKRLSALLPTVAPTDAPIDFGVDAPPATGEMHTASGSEAVKKARASLNAAETELGIAQMVVSVVTHIAERFGVVL